MTDTYDAIVVGARCAGSPTAMLLARKGYRVLVVDRATFPSDTLSTHVLQPLGRQPRSNDGDCSTPGRDRLPADPHLLLRLRPLHDRWRARHGGRAGRVLSRGGPCSTSCSSTPPPRRARRFAKASPSKSSLIEDGRVVGIKGIRRAAAAVTERARVVIGADGRHSLVAAAVQPEQYNEKPPLLAAYYTYWSGLPIDGRFDTYIRPTARICGGADPRRLDADRRRVAATRSSTRTSKTSRATS